MALGESTESFKPLDRERLAAPFIHGPRGVFRGRYLRRLAGIDRRRALGRGCLQAVDANDRDRIATEWDKLVARGGPGEDLRFRQVGEEVNLRFLAASLTNVAGATTGFAVAVTNITQFVDDATSLRESGAQFRAMAEAMH